MRVTLKDGLVKGRLTIEGFTRSVLSVMHPHAPSCAPVALVDQTEVAPKRHRRGGSSFMAMIRGTIVTVAASGVTAFALWLKQETPHPVAAIAIRESPLVEARSLKSPLQTVQSSALTAYGLKKDPAPAVKPVPVVKMMSLEPELPQGPTVKRVLPVWLMADVPEFADVKNTRLSPTQTIERLRQSLREAGARQMGQVVRFAVLNLAELLAMEPNAWAAGQETPAASENRASAMLLTFYLNYLDRAGDAAGVNALRRAMEEGMQEERAVREFILAGRSVADMEREMGLAFADAGVELRFTRRGGAALSH
ncbi:MAG: hypothetical protein JWR15_3976 [Prosthecobacter sp.]|nr:hypothetical protein [Prosthecobacter sp.]